MMTVGKDSKDYFHEQNTDEAALQHLPVHANAPMCVSEGTFAHFPSHILGILCRFQMSDLFKITEFHLVVVKWSHCSVIVIKNAMTFCSLTNETKRSDRPHSPLHCDRFPIFQTSLIINNVFIIKVKTPTVKRVRKLKEDKQKCQRVMDNC